jgi:hypothetical protein
MKRDPGGVTPLDELAMGLESSAITRGKALKLGGAALLASAMGVFAAEGEAQARFGTLNRKACERQGGVFCRSSETGQKICCRARKTPCCGKFGAQCCQSAAKCNQGKCVRT